nr:transposase family protein [Streptomyces klenkii]
MRHDLPHTVLGLVFGVDRSTITRTVGEIRPPAGRRGRGGEGKLWPASSGSDRCVPRRSGRGRRGAAGRPRDPGPQAIGRPRRTSAFVSGKKKQNTMKTTVIADWCGRALWIDPVIWPHVRRHGRLQQGHRRLLVAHPRCGGSPGRRLCRPGTRPPRLGDHPAKKATAPSGARKNGTAGT